MRAVRSIGGTRRPLAAAAAARAAPDGRWPGLASAEAGQICGQCLKARDPACIERGLSLAVYPSGRNLEPALRVEDAGPIVRPHGGVGPAVEFLEGCSP